MKMTGAEIVIQLLERQGIKVIPGIPGGANLPLYDALSKSTSIRHVLARHEQGAGFIAQGMARVTGSPQVCFATSGPGATNLLTAIADAKLDSIPLICITGQVSSSLIGTDAFQEVDVYGMTIPVTKHNFLVRSAAELFRVIPEAFRIASSGRPGPVLIDIPKDVQNQEVSFSGWPEPGRPDPILEPDADSIERAIDLINSAQRPILYLGGGVNHAGAGPLALQLVEKAGLPTTMTLMGLGAIPVDHPLALGMLGMHAAPYTNLALEECDLLIAAGVRFDERATGKVTEFCPRARIIHIDIDPGEIDRLKVAHVGIVGDVNAVISTLLPLVEERPHREWLDFISSLKARYISELNIAKNPHTPCSLIKQAASLLDDEAVIVTDVGQHQMWTARNYPFRRSRQFLTSGGLGTMGFGLPASIGASLACPDRKVVCFSGDGSIMMNIQELATAVEQKTPVKVVLMNNNALGMVRQLQELFYGRRIYETFYTSRVDFVTIAKGFGVETYDLAGVSDPRGILETAFKSDAPCLIHAPIDMQYMVYPMVPPGASNKEMIGGKVRVHS